MQRPQIRNGPRLPHGPPPQRHDDGTPPTRTAWRACERVRARRNAAYQQEHPEWVIPDPPTPEPVPNFWERLGDLWRRPSLRERVRQTARDVCGRYR